MAREVGAGRVGRVGSGGIRHALRARYLPIADHGLIGDLHTVALVGTDGTIDWYCCPRFDSPSVFAAILDAGMARVRPDWANAFQGAQPRWGRWSSPDCRWSLREQRLAIRGQLASEGGPLASAIRDEMSTTIETVGQVVHVGV